METYQKIIYMRIDVANRDFAICVEGFESKFSVKMHWKCLLLHILFEMVTDILSFDVRYRFEKSLPINADQLPPAECTFDAHSQGLQCLLNIISCCGAVLSQEKAIAGKPLLLQEYIQSILLQFAVSVWSLNGNEEVSQLLISSWREFGCMGDLEAAVTNRLQGEYSLLPSPTQTGHSPQTSIGKSHRGKQNNSLKRSFIDAIASKADNSPDPSMRFRPQSPPFEAPKSKLARSNLIDDENQPEYLRVELSSSELDKLESRCANAKQGIVPSTYTAADRARLDAQSQLAASQEIDAGIPLIPEKMEEESPCVVELAGAARDNEQDAAGAEEMMTSEQPLRVDQELLEDSQETLRQAQEPIEMDKEVLLEAEIPIEEAQEVVGPQSEAPGAVEVTKTAIEEVEEVMVTSEVAQEVVRLDHAVIEDVMREVLAESGEAHSPNNIEDRSGMDMIIDRSSTEKEPECGGEEVVTSSEIRSEPDALPNALPSGAAVVEDNSGNAGKIVEHQEDEAIPRGTELVESACSVVDQEMVVEHSYHKAAVEVAAGLNIDRIGSAIPLDPEEFIVEKRSEVYASFVAETTIQVRHEAAAEKGPIVADTASTARVARVAHADVVGDCMGSIIVSTAFRAHPTLQSHPSMEAPPVIDSNADLEMSQDSNADEDHNDGIAHTMVDASQCYHDTMDIAATMVDGDDGQQQESMDYAESESNTVPQQQTLLAEVVAGIEHVKTLLGHYQLTINNVAGMSQKERYVVREDILNAWHHSHELTSSLYELSSLFRKV